MKLAGKGVEISPAIYADPGEGAYLLFYIF